MENQLFLSIVIPVYNGANTISRCLNSIWSQELESDEYEVICVDDCSKDDTLFVIKDVQKLHQNLRLLSNPENLRAGGARNHGVREARGEYILFIDADDYYHQGSLKEAVAYLKSQKDLDILMCDSSREMPNKPSDTLVHNCQNKSVMTGRDFLLNNGYPLAPWKFFFRKNLMLNNQCFFEEKVQAEDVDWVYKMGLLANRMQYQPILLVHYVLEINSQTAFNKSEKNLKDTLFCVDRLLGIALQYTEKDELLFNAIRNISLSYFSEGIKMMLLMVLPVSQKVDFINKSNISGNERLVRFVKKNPKLFAVCSNVFAPILSVLQKYKRILKGRM